MKNFNIISVFSLCLAMFAVTTISAQCPNGGNLAIKFDNVAINYDKMNVSVDVLVSNNGEGNMSISALSGRFNYNKSLLKAPVLNQTEMAGKHSISNQNDVISYGLLEFSKKNVLATSGEWTKVGNLNFELLRAPKQGETLELIWNRPTDFPATNAIQYISMQCQPEVMMVGFGDMNKEINCSDATPLTVDSKIIASSGANDGVAELKINGGLSPYAVEWSNGDNAPVAAGLAVGVYTAIVTDAFNCSKEVEVQMVEKKSTVAIALGENNITMYPNPAVEKVYLNLDLVAESDVTISMLDMNGKLVYSYNALMNGTTTHEIEVSALSAGQYLMNFDLNGELSSKKIVIAAHN